MSSSGVSASRYELLLLAYLIVAKLLFLTAPLFSALGLLAAFTSCVSRSQEVQEVQETQEAQETHEAPAVATSRETEELEDAGRTSDPGGRLRRIREPRVQHIVLFVADTLRADRTPPFHRSHIFSPAIERFASGGLAFRRAYATSGWTKPSVASLLTGLEVHRHGTRTHQHRLGEEHALLTETLKGAGFYTAGVITNGYISEAYGFQRGWDRTLHAKETKRWRGEKVAEDVARILRERPKDRPLFLYIHTTDPHAPYEPEPRDLARYDRRAYRGPIHFGGDKLFLERIRRDEIRLRPRDRQRLIALYDAEISYHDRQFGAIHQALAREGILEDALFIFTSDHGEELFDHGSVSHGGRRLYEELVRVPMIVSHPSIAGAIREERVSLLDIAPTIFHELGFAPRPALNGRPLTERLPEARTLLFETYGIRGILEGELKFTIETAGSGLAEREIALYDLKRDPREKVNLAKRQPEEAARLLERLEALRDGIIVQAASVSDAELDEATLEQLRELGYIE